jgi:hypothetical protein
MERVAWQRREFLAGLGIAVGAGLEVARTALADSSEIPGKGHRIIRTVLKDIEPREITGATLMHEHLGLERRPNGRGDAPPASPTEDESWVEEELNAARASGWAVLCPPRPDSPVRWCSPT